MTIDISNPPRIIDTDTHVTEPADLWTSRLPKKWGDDIMHVRWVESKNSDMWCIGDKVTAKAWRNTMFGFTDMFPERLYPDGPNTLEECHPAGVEWSERVKVMDLQGVRTAVLYPNIGGLNATHFVSMEPTIAAAHCSAYNDYQLESSMNFPGRFLPMLVVPFWDVPAAVAEIERMSDKGFGGIVSTGAPQNHGQPFLADPHWNPMWQACVDAGLSVSFHVANGGVGEFMDEKRMSFDVPGASLSRSSTLQLDNGKQITDLLLSGVLVRYPDLNFVSVESGLGWIPFVLECLDYHFKKATQGVVNHPWGDLLPSDLFHRQVYVNFWFEQLEQWHIDAIGVDHILFETDFPHPTCLTPEDVTESIKVGMRGFSREVQEKILWGNAEKLYGLSESA